MKVVWKFPIEEIGGITDIEMPLASEILTVQPQGGKVNLWAHCDTETDKIRRRILVVGTGQEIPESVLRMEYISTFQLQGGFLIFHAFEIVTG